MKKLIFNPILFTALFISPWLHIFSDIFDVDNFGEQTDERDCVICI